MSCIITSKNPALMRFPHLLLFISWWLDLLICKNEPFWHKIGVKWPYYTTVIAKIKGMPWSLFYDIPSYVTMDYEKWHTFFLLTQCEEIHAFEVQNHVNLCVDFTFQLWCWPSIFHIKISNLGEELLFQVKIPLLKHFVGKNR